MTFCSGLRFGDRHRYFHNEKRWHKPYIFFGFDLTFAEVVHSFERFPGLLIPHSHIFGGVNGCQTGLALKYASEWCSELHILYIVGMNSNDLQKIANEEIGGEEIFDPSPSIIFSKLTDQEEGGFVTSRF